VIGSLELSGEKTHGNSAGRGQAAADPDREMRLSGESGKTYVTYIIGAGSGQDRGCPFSGRDFSGGYFDDFTLLLRASQS